MSARLYLATEDVRVRGLSQDERELNRLSMIEQLVISLRVANQELVLAKAHAAISSARVSAAERDREQAIKSLLLAQAGL